MRSFDVCVVISMKKLLNKQPMWRTFETPWCLYDISVMPLEISQCCITSRRYYVWKFSNPPYYSDVTVGFSYLKSQATWMLIQQFVRLASKKISKPVALALWEFTGDRGFRAQKASNAENLSMWWRHYASCSPLSPQENLHHRETNVCGGQRREQLAYTSDGHVIDIYIISTAEQEISFLLHYTGQYWCD